MTPLARDRAAIRRLRRGVVASSHIRALSVGTDPIVREVGRLLHERPGGAAAVRFVDGEWGTGKTFLLALIHQLALDEGYAVAFLNLNGRSAALNHPQRFYHLIAGRVRLIKAQAGLPSVVQALVRHQAHHPRLGRWAVETRHSSEFAAALARILSWRNNHDDAPAHAWSVLLGTDLAWADYPYKREKALYRIADLGECLAASGAGGLVLQLDELETIDQLWNVRSRIGAYSVLGRLIAMSHVLPFFAVTDRFDRLVDSDLKFKGLLDEKSLPADARTFLERWQRHEYPTLHPTIMTTELAGRLIGKIVDLYHGAYGPGVRRVDRAALVKEWTKSPLRSPRTLIRRAVHELDLARDGSA